MSLPSLQQIEHVVGAHRAAAEIANKSREAYRVAHAQAFLDSMEKTEAGRKARADISTAYLREVRDADAVMERAAYHLMIAIRGSAGEPERSAA